MKLTIMLFFISISLNAQDLPVPQSLDIGGITPLVGEKLKEMKAASTIYLDSKVGGALVLPIWTLHGASQDYLEIGAGAEIRQTENIGPIVSVCANLPALSSRFWNFAWAKDHIRRSVFPPILFGPQIRLPTRSLNSWKGINNIGVMASVRLGK